MFCSLQVLELLINLVIKLFRCANRICDSGKNFQWYYIFIDVQFYENKG